MSVKESNNKDPLKKATKDITTYAKYSAMGFQMFAIIAIFAYVGYRIDQNRQMETPLYTAFLSLVGVFVSLYVIIRSVKKLNNP